MLGKTWLHKRHSFESSPSNSHSSPSSFCISLNTILWDNPQCRPRSNKSRPRNVHFGHLNGFCVGRPSITSSRKWLNKWTPLSLVLLTLCLNSSPQSSQLGILNFASIVEYTGRAARSVMSLSSRSSLNPGDIPSATFCFSFFCLTISRSRVDGMNSERRTFWVSMTRASKS